MVAVYMGAAALWLILSIPPRESDDLAYYLGQIFGGALFTLGAFPVNGAQAFRIN